MILSFLTWYLISIVVGLCAYPAAVSYTHLRAHETVLDLVCRLLLEKKKKQIKQNNTELKKYNIKSITEPVNQ